MKVIVHIGTEKTGSTSIQEYLYQNQRKFNDAGIHYVQSVGKKNHLPLVSCFIRNDKYNGYLDSLGITSSKERGKYKHDMLEAFKNEIQSLKRGIHTVVISSEHFHSAINTSEEVHHLYEILSSYFSEVKVVCYLREQVATCISHYSTVIKHGADYPINGFIQRCDPENIYYNYYEMLLNWESSFGSDSLDIAIFDRNQFINRDLLDDFTGRIDPNLIGLLNKDVQTENESLTVAGQALGRAVNKVFYKPKGGELDAVWVKCQRIISTECKGRGEQPSLDVQINMFNQFIDSNEKVRKKFFPRMKEIFNKPSGTPASASTIDDGFVSALSSIFNTIIDDAVGVAIPDRYAILFRDAAFMIEKENIELAYELMKLSHKIRPSGPLIKLKVEEYRQRII